MPDRRNLATAIEGVAFNDSAVYGKSFHSSAIIGESEYQSAGVFSQTDFGGGDFSVVKIKRSSEDLSGHLTFSDLVAPLLQLEDNIEETDPEGEEIPEVQRIGPLILGTVDHVDRFVVNPNTRDNYSLPGFKLDTSSMAEASALVMTISNHAHARFDITSEGLLGVNGVVESTAAAIKSDFTFDEVYVRTTPVAGELKFYNVTDRAIDGLNHPLPAFNDFGFAPNSEHLYFRHLSQYSKIWIEVSTPSVEGTYAPVLQYWTGTGWLPVPFQQDFTQGFIRSGFITFTAPPGWVAGTSYLGSVGGPSLTNCWELRLVNTTLLQPEIDAIAKIQKMRVMVGTGLQECYSVVQEKLLVAGGLTWIDETWGAANSSQSLQTVRVSGDSIYLRSENQFSEIYVNMEPPLSSSSVAYPVLEYYCSDVSAWCIIPDIFDGTINFSVTGSIEFTPPEDWVKTNRLFEESGIDVDEKYEIRLRPVYFSTSETLYIRLLTKKRFDHIIGAFEGNHDQFPTASLTTGSGGRLKLKAKAHDGCGSPYYLSFTPSGSQSTDINLIFPSDAGTIGKALVTDGTGILSWGGLSSTGTALANQVAYWSDPTTLTGNANFTFDGTTESVQSLNIATTGSASVGVIKQNNTVIFHSYTAGGGTQNLFLGVQAGNFTLSATGGRNVGIGWDSHNNLTSGNYNTGLGYSSNSRVTTGSYNVAIGMSSNYAITTGSSNIAIGTNSNYGNGSNSVTGNNNVAIGVNSLYNINSTAANNVMLGNSTGYAITTGSSNVFIGNGSGRYETGSDKLFIDNATRASEADGRAKALIYGVFNASEVSQRLTFNSTIGVGTPATGTSQWHVLSADNGRIAAVVRSAAVPTVDSLQVQNNSGTALVRIDSAGDIITSGYVQVDSAQAFYLGDSATDGSWRFIRNGSNLNVERRESGSWVQKGQWTP